MTKQEYNGWFNKETWNIHMMFQQTFDNMCKQQGFDDVQHVADSFENIVQELEVDQLRNGSFAQQCVADYLNEVNWLEIAEHYVEDFNLLEEDEDEEDEVGTV